MASEAGFPNLRHLRVFCAVARAQSLSAAAARLPLSQPAMTQAIAGLENYFGATLFNRRNDGMQLTTGGEQCLARVERALAILAACIGETERGGVATNQHRSPAAAIT